MPIECLDCITLKPFEMPVAFEGIFSRANTEDTVSRATTPTTMPECTDAPAQSFGSKRPRKETGDVLANIQNANIRKATPGGNICLLYTSPSPRDVEESRMPSSA